MSEGNEFVIKKRGRGDFCRGKVVLRFSLESIAPCAVPIFFVSGFCRCGACEVVWRDFVAHVFDGTP